MSELPTAEELFGAPPKKQPPTADQLFGPRELIEAQSLGGEYMDAYFTGQAGGRFLEQFGHGFNTGWGTKPLGVDPKTEKELKEAGIFGDYEKGTNNIIRKANEAILRPLAAVVDFTMRFPYAVSRGLAETETPLALLGAAGAAGMEAFPAGPHTALPHPAMGITGERYPGITPNEAPRSPFTPRPEGPVPSGPPLLWAIEGEPAGGLPRDIVGVNERARAADPETFQAYDALANRRESLLEYEREQLKPQTYNIDGREVPADTPLDKVEEFITRPLSEQETSLFTRRGGPKSGQAEVLDTIREEIKDIDGQMERLAPKVREAYKNTAEVEPVAETPPISYEITEPPKETVPEPPRDILGDIIEGAAPRTPAEIQTLAQRRPPIAQDVARQVLDAGRSEEEARAIGAIWQAHYEARAARFPALGSARDLYEKEAPKVISSEAERAKGSLSLAENTITLMRDADASTLIHESGHAWFEELLGDAKRPEAPEDLVADVDAVKGWLQMTGDRPSRAQHEKFARGFERYVMEGTAPSGRLAKVFEQFRQWLTHIYESLARLRAPINDEIRGVYDRLLATPRSEVVIAPERPVDLNFADVHVNDAARALPDEALLKADQIANEREAIAQVLRPEINNGRRRTRVDPTAGPEPATEGAAERTGVAGRGGEGQQPQRVGEEPPPEPAEVGPGGASFKAESAAPSGPNEPFGPTTTRLTDREGKPVLDRIEAHEDIDTAIQEMVASQGTQGELRGEQLSPHATFDLADAIGVEPGQIDRARVGAAYSPAEIEALARLAVEAETDVRNKLIQAANGGDVLETAIAISRLEMIQGKAVQAANEWGRAGAALRAFKKVTGDTAVNSLNTLLKRHTGRSYDELLQLAAQAQNLPTPGHIGKTIRNSRVEMGPIGRAITYLVTNSYLSGQFTHVGYVIGNQLRVAMLPIETAAQGSVGAVRAGVRALWGEDTPDRVYLREAGSALIGIGPGTLDAMRPAYESYLAGKQIPLPGDTHYTNPWSAHSPFGSTATNIFGQPLKLVAGIHQFSRVQFYTQYMYELTMRKALSEGLRGQDLSDRVAELRNNPTADIMAASRERADAAMFQRQTEWNSLQARLSAWTERHVLPKLIFPFMKIGFETAREFLIKRTPVGILSPEVRGQLMMREGGAAFDEAAGRMILGTGIATGGVFLAAQSITTGAGPHDPKQKAEWELHRKPYYMTIGNISVPMAGLGYPGQLLQFSADLWEAGHYAKDNELNTLAESYIRAFMHTPLEEGFFRSMANLMDVVKEPGRNLPRFLAGLGMGFVPYGTAISQTNRAFIDPHSKSVAPGTITSIWDNIRARMPVMSWDIPNRYDAFGEPVISRGAVPSWNAGARYANDPTVKWLDSIGTMMGHLDRKIHGQDLTDAQWDSYQRISGRLSKELLDSARDALTGLPVGMQRKEIDKFIGTARNIARTEIKMNALGSSNDIVDKVYKQKMKLLE